MKLCSFLCLDIVSFEHKHYYGRLKLYNVAFTFALVCVIWQKYVKAFRHVEGQSMKQLFNKAPTFASLTRAAL